MGIRFGRHSYRDDMSDENSKRIWETEEKLVRFDCLHKTRAHESISTPLRELR